MTTLTLSESSPTNTILTDPYGTLVYEISTPSSLSHEITTVKKNGQVLAAVKWGFLGGSKLTMGGTTAPLNDVFPKTSMLSDSRIFTAASGDRLKWKYESKLQCTSADSGLPFATYNHKMFSDIRSKKSTLEIFPNATHLIDVLVVTWSISEKKARDNGIAEGTSAVVEAVVAV